MISFELLIVCLFVFFLFPFFFCFLFTVCVCYYYILLVPSTTKSNHLHPSPHLTSPSLRPSRKTTDRQRMPRLRQRPTVNNRWHPTVTTGITVHRALWIIQTGQQVVVAAAAAAVAAVAMVLRLLESTIITAIIHTALRRPIQLQPFTTVSIPTVTKMIPTVVSIQVLNYSNSQNNNEIFSSHPSIHPSVKLFLFFGCCDWKVNRWPVNF